MNISSLVRGYYVQYVTLQSGEERAVEMPDLRWIDVRGDWLHRGVRSRAGRDDPGVNMLSDLVLFEDAVYRIENPEVRAAVCLSSWGWDPAEIGAVLRSKRTGHQLLGDGIRVLRDLVGDAGDE